MALPAQVQGDTIEYTAVFAVELIDPVTLQVVPRGGISATATFAQAGLWGRAVSRGSRFVWVLPSNVDPAIPPATPTSVTVVPPANSGYATFTYSAADIQAGTTTNPDEWNLCRLYLRTLPTYVFPSSTTGVYGLLRKVLDVQGQPTQVLAGAQVWLQWQDASQNPQVARAGLRCLSGPQGDFAASLVFPSKASKSYPAAAANGDLTLALYVAQPDQQGGWTQAHLDSNSLNALGSVRAGQVTTLAAPIAWSNLTAG
jgi:hypothetical protein